MLGLLRRTLLGWLCAGLSVCAVAQGSNGQILYAGDFGKWSLPEGTSPTNGMIQWQATQCTVPSLGFTFVAPKVGRPLLIRDSNPALSETVIPTSVIINNSSCTVAATMAHTHYTYEVYSGTGGLQEAIDYELSQSAGALVALTTDWTVNGGQTSMLSAATGATGASVIDERTSCFKAYNWNGSAYAQTANFCTGGPGSGITALSQDVTAAGSGSVPATVVGIHTNAIPSLSAGYLHWNGSAFVWDSPPGGVSSAQGTSPVQVNGDSGTPHTGSITVSCPTCGNANLQMKSNPGGSGQHVLVFATSASCSGGSDNTCTYSGFALPSYVVQANVTAVYAIAISGSNDIGGSELEAWQATGGGATWPGGQFNLVPGDVATDVWAPGQATVPASPLPTNYSGISFSGEFCCHGDTISVSMAALDIYYTGTAPPAYNPLLIQYPLNYNPQTNTLSLYSPFDAGYDFGAVNALQVIVPLLVNGPALGDQMTLIPGHTSTSTTPTVAVTNAALSGAYPIVNQDGSALFVGELAVGVPSLLQFDGAKWRLVGSGAVASVSNVDGSLTISPNIGPVVASLNVGNANTWTATQTFSQIIDTGLVGTSTSPVCPNGAGGALTQSGCTTGNGISSGSGYALPAYGSGASTTLGPSNITTDSTNNNLIVPGSGTFGSGGSTHGLKFPAGTCSAGVAGSVVYCTDGTNGYAQVNENNTGLVRLCDSTNGVCGSNVTNTTITTGTGAVSGTCSSNTLSSAVTMTGFTTANTLTFTPTTDLSSVSGWDTGALYFVPVPGSGSFQWRLCTGNSGGTTPGGSVTWNVSAR